MEFPVSERTRMQRMAQRAAYDRDIVYRILDEALIASVAAAIDGRPEVLPMIHARIGDSLFLHGRAGNRMLTAIANGAEACINVVLLDSLLIARTIEDHSMHYRSATVYGRGTLVAEAEEKQRVMATVFDSLVRAERFATLPPLRPGYLDHTMVVRVPIEEAVAKVNDRAEGSRGPEGIWSGVIPLAVTAGEPVADARTLAEGLAPPDEAVRYRR